MPNAVKYKTGNLTGSLQKGNVALGISGSLGPTSTTGWYNGPNPVAGKYQIFETAVSGDPDVFCPQDDNELIKFARWKGATGADTGSAAAVLAWIGTQTNLMAANFQYESIVTDGLVLNLDAGFVGGYPTTGTTWYDLSGNTNNGTLTNGPTFNSANSGSLVFDGIDDYGEVTSRNTNLEFQPTSGYSCMVFYKSPSVGTNSALIANMDNISGTFPGWDLWFNNASISNTIGMHLISSWGTNAIKVAVDYNYSTYANQWLCFGYTYDGSCPTTTQGTLDSVNFYLNGTLYTSGKQLGQIGGAGDGFNTSSETITYNTSQRFRVASRWSNAGPSSISSFTVGTVLVYNRKLSSSEMLQNYNAQKGRFGL